MLSTEERIKAAQYAMSKCWNNSYKVISNQSQDLKKMLSTEDSKNTPIMLSTEESKDVPINAIYRRKD